MTTTTTEALARIAEQIEGAERCRNHLEAILETDWSGNLTNHELLGCVENALYRLTEAGVGHHWSLL